MALLKQYRYIYCDPYYLMKDYQELYLYIRVLPAHILSKSNDKGICCALVGGIEMHEHFLHKEQND